VMPTFHPSYLIRFPKERHKTWEDMQQVMEYLAAHENI
jgi:uracil-DNA glycosylase